LRDRKESILHRERRREDARNSQEKGKGKHTCSEEKKTDGKNNEIERYWTGPERKCVIY
jgi:hypothetical protein